MNIKYLTRQMDVINYDTLGKSITVVGAGAIGSFTTLSLAKMGCFSLTVYDDDKVDTENMNCQFYRPQDIGKLKAYALRDLVQEFTDVKTEAMAERVLSHFALMDMIVVSAVDSMQARKDIYKACRAGTTRFLIDPRMSAEYGQIYTVDLCSAAERKNYEGTLYTDEQAIQERCTAKSTIYTVNLLAGYVSKIVKELLQHNQVVMPELQWCIKNDDLFIPTKGVVNE